MIKLFGLIFLIASAASASVEKYSLGIGTGITHPFAEENFKDSASTGNSYHYWLGYRFSPSFGLELAHEALDFDQLNSSSKALNLSAVFNLNPNAKIYPFLKLGVGAAEHTFQNTTISKKSGVALKASVGLNFDIWKCIGVQAGLNYQAYEKMTDSLKNTQALNPYVAAVFKFGSSEEIHVQELESKPVAAQPQTVTAAAVTPEFKDQDNDGVADGDDKCANTAPGVKVNNFGCSLTEKVEVVVNVNFAPGRAEITPETIGEVSKLADFMKKYKETTVIVSGHTDSTGSRKRNIAVSEARAKAVRTELVKLGVEENRISAKGFGPDKPIADNSTSAGKKANRRVVAEIKAEVEAKGK